MSTLLSVVNANLRGRFAALARPGELAPHLSTPFSAFSVLEADFLLAAASLAVLRALLPRIPSEKWRDVVMEMSALADVAHVALHELLTWNERHAANNGAPYPETDLPIEIGALSSRTEYHIGAVFAFTDLLPLADALLKLGKREAHEYRPVMCPDPASGVLGVVELTGLSGRPAR